MFFTRFSTSPLDLESTPCAMVTTTGGISNEKDSDRILFMVKWKYGTHCKDAAERNRWRSGSALVIVNSALLLKWRRKGDR